MFKISSTVNSVLPCLKRLYTAVLVSGSPVIFTSLIVTVLLIGARQFGWLQVQELWAFDQLIRLRPEEKPDQRLLIVAVTEEDIQEQRKWPLPDQTIEQVLDKLEQFQPRAIGLDIYRDLPVPPGDSALTKRLKQSDSIISVCRVSDSSGNLGTAPPLGVPDNRIGFSDLPIDSGGILRRSLLFINPPPLNNTARQNLNPCRNPTADLYSFSLRLALNYLLEVKRIKPELTPSNELKLDSTIFTRLKLKSGGYQKIDAAGYQVLLNYRSPHKIAQQVTLTDVLTGKVNPNWIKNRIVLIGTTAESINDFFYTPYSAGQKKNQQMSGISIHAQEVSQILSAVLDHRPLFSYWSSWGEALWICTWSLVGGVLAWHIRHPLGFGLANGAALGGLFLVCFGFFLQGIWIPLVPSAFALITTAGSVVLVDRFNKAGYTKAIYTHVKGALKINVEVDQSKKERQVAEITQTEYFQNLRKRGKELRIKKTNTRE